MDHIITSNMSERKNMLLGLKCEETGKLRNLCAYVMSTHVRVRWDTMDSPTQLKYLRSEHHLPLLGIPGLDQQ